jgi:hypothetical protein
MRTREVEVYLLWQNGSWDKKTVEVPAEPWTDDAVESRAVQKALLLLDRWGYDKPIQIGLLMNSFANHKGAS